MSGSVDAGAQMASTYGAHTRDLLLDLVEFSDLASRLVERGKDAYDKDEMLRLAAEAISHRIGEAVARLSDRFIVDHPAIEWRKIKGMRNIVAHDYARIDHEILWNALADRMPELAAYLRDILQT